MPDLVYKKLALTFLKQFQHSGSNGMAFDNRDKAQKQLSCISYYRLSGYWYSFRLRDDERVTNHFEPDTRYGSAVALYEFNREFRLLVLDGIEWLWEYLRTGENIQYGNK